MPTISVHDFERERELALLRNVVAQFRTLMQEKHLYQSVQVEPTDKYTVRGENDEPIEQSVKHLAEQIKNAWRFKPNPNPTLRPTTLYFSPPDLKLFCGRCSRIEAFNLVTALDVFQGIQTEPFYTKGGIDQVFLFTYRCQSCKGTPEVFTVRRRGLKLTNEGRSPIEHAEVPKVIPDVVKRFFSGALVAHQSGQTLAGVFLLRTLIEQWARISTGRPNGYADEVLEAYMAQLPDDFKNRFHSMRTLYADLSVDIHTAVGSGELFETAIAHVVQHYEARRLFKLG